MSFRRLIAFPLLVTFVALGAACSREPGAEAPAAATQPASASWQAFVDRFVEDSFVANPFFGVDAGRHEFDGKAPDWSAAGIAKEVARLNAARDEANAFPAEALTPEQRFERDYLVSVINRELFWLDTAQFPFKNPAWYISRLDPDPYLSREYAPLEKRMQGYIGYARAIPRLAADIRANLRTPLPKTFVERGIAGFGGYAEFYRTDVPKVFESVRNEALQKELAEANEAAAKAMDGLKSWLESEAAQATDDYALGAVLFSQMLEQTEGVRISLEELEAAGKADLERNLDALREACGQYLPKGTIPACIARMNSHKPKEGTVATASEQLESLRNFVRTTNVVSIPTDQQARVKEAPPYNRGNFAYINIPGPFESKDVAWTYFVAPPDPAWSPKEREEYIPGVADLLFTSVHEVWPGHFLQFQHATRNPSKVASLWVGYAFAEGWAHYTEELMWDIGLGNGDPEFRVGQLTNALLRDVRYLSAIGLHTQGMTVAQSEQMFREKAFADVGTARQQAARGTYDPAYLNYTLGKLMILKLRRDWMALNPPAPGIPADSPERYRAFHDKFLSYGGPPIPLVRREMLSGSGGDGSLL
ncbi:MAG: DUF885 domain-containing protein [Steroidobacteraceae bacterium]|nr:DUF885 domain-containing protein [Steroidobacteraceae bacterium]